MHSSFVSISIHRQMFRLLVAAFIVNTCVACGSGSNGPVTDSVTSTVPPENEVSIQNTSPDDAILIDTAVNVALSVETQSEETQSIDVTDVFPNISQSSRAIKVMPLGDSITAGYNSCSYRTPLVSMLANSAVEFVGSRSHQKLHPDTCSQTNMLHDGRSGWRTIDWLNKSSDDVTSIVRNAVRIEAPNVILLHIGSNDINRGEAPGSFDLTTGTGTETIGRIDQMIDEIFSELPAVDLYVADIIPWLGDEQVNSKLDFLRLELNKLLTYRKSSGDKIRKVPVHQNFSSTLMQSDLVHPNKEGDIYLANQWLNTLQLDGYFLDTSTTSTIRVEAEFGEFAGTTDAQYDDTRGYTKVSSITGKLEDHVTLEFTVQHTGTYQVLGNVRRTNSEAGSLRFQALPGDYIHWYVPESNDFVTDYVGEGPKYYLYLTAGNHSIRVYLSRVDASLDWIELQYLGNDPTQDSDNDGTLDIEDSFPNDSSR